MKHINLWEMPVLSNGVNTPTGLTFSLAMLNIAILWKQISTWEVPDGQMWHWNLQPYGEG